MTINQAEKGKRFRQLHAHPGAFVIPNPWDAGTARLLEGLGFEALATTSAGLAFSLGRSDGCGAVTPEETLANAAAIVEATGLPVSADLEGGFGVAPEASAETIRRAARVGLVGASIEDWTGDPENPIHDPGLAAERIRAASEAAGDLGFDFLLTARAENHLHGIDDLADTIARLQAYQEAGADVLYAPGLRTREQIASLVASVDRPVNVVMGLIGLDATIAELSALGVSRISVGSSLARAALAAFVRSAEQIIGEGRFDYAKDALPMAELNEVFAVVSER